MSSNKIFVTKATMPSYEEYIEAIKPLWDTHMLTNMGKYYQELEHKLKESLCVPAISLFANGHLALELTLQASNLSGEVITTPFTFVSTTHAIVRNGLQPVFCDIKEEDYTIDETKIEDLITSKTSAILPVHVYGNVCAVDTIARIAQKHHLKVIYDAAHAFGVRYKGHGIGSFGDASIFSFHATKSFNTIEGGAVATSNEELLRTLYKLKNFGFKNEIEVDGIGGNAKLNEFQAIMGLCNLVHFEENVKKRKVLFERYNSNLDNISGISISNKFHEETRQNYSYYPIVINDQVIGKTRDDVRNALMKQDIFPRRYFYPLTKDFKCYKDRFHGAVTPVAEKIAKSVLTLPLYTDLGLDEVDRICSIIRRTVNE